MKILGIALRTIKYALITMMLIIFLSNFYVMIMSVNNPGTHPDVFGYSTAVVISGSMQPEINIDDLVVIKEQKEYYVGDVIAFTTGKSFVTHRIIEETPSGFVTKGDANNTEDQFLVKEKDISGKVIYTVPKVGSITTFLKSPLGMMLLILFGFIIIILPEKNNNAEMQK